MPREIERKFLVGSNLREALAAREGVDIAQGYLQNNNRVSVRVRIKGNKGYLNIKSSNIGIARDEYEYEIPVEEAKELLEKFCPKAIIKTRYLIPYAGKTWEVDIFKGPNDGLIIAEIELNSEDETFKKPVWITEEVTQDIRYYNPYLAEHPYREWPQNSN